MTVEVKVHILRHGRALCTSMHGIPEVWPKGHRWVSYLSQNIFNLATCDECREAYTLIPPDQLRSDRRQQGLKEGQEG